MKSAFGIGFVVFSFLLTAGLGGKFLFFKSNRISALNDRPIPDGLGNIFWVEASIIEGLRPKK